MTRFIKDPSDNELELLRDVSELETELARVLEEKAALKAELSELMDGIPIEKADKNKEYLHYSHCDWKVVHWSEGKQSWVYQGVPYLIPVCPDLLYPLPAQTQEGS